MSPKEQHASGHYLTVRMGHVYHIYQFVMVNWTVPMAKDEHECSISTMKVTHWKSKINKETEATVPDVIHCRTVCHPHHCTCHTLYVQQVTGGCVPFLHLDHQSKEYSANIASDSLNNIQILTRNITQTSFLEEMYACSDSKIIPLRYVNDLIPDCMTSEDEELYIRYRKGQLQQGDIHSAKCVDLGKHQCVDDIDFAFCYDLKYHCFYDLDNLGHQKGCRNGAHLRYCEDHQCNISKNDYKCYNKILLYPTEKGV